MFGWLSAAAALASRTNRSIRFRSAATSAGKIFNATFRSSFVSCARYTSPIPPAPIFETMRYWDSFMSEDGSFIYAFRLVPRVGVEPTRPYGQRILSPVENILPDLTKRDEPIFTGLAAVK